MSAGYFEMLGARPARGRVFRPDEDVVAGSGTVAVLSYGLWQDRFGGQDSALGATIRLGTTAYEVVVDVAPGEAEWHHTDADPREVEHLVR